MRQVRDPRFPPSFPPTIRDAGLTTGVLPGAPFPPQAPRGTGFPASSVPRSARTSAVLPASLGFPRPAVPLLRPFLLPAREGVPRWAWTVWVGLARARVLERRPAEPHRFLTIPNVHMPRSSTPPGRHAWLSHVPVLSSVISNTSTPGLPLSRLNSAAYALPVYASQRPVTRPSSPSWGLSSGLVSTQDSVPAVAIFAGWDCLPTGFQRKVSAMRSTWHPPFPGLAWRAELRNHKRA